MPYDSSRVKTVSTYSPGTKWTFSARSNGFEHTEELVLYAEPNGAAISDDYLPDEISAGELWRLWADKYANQYHQEWPSLYRQGEVLIDWTVAQPMLTGIFERAPYARTTPAAPELVKLFGDVPNEDFLTHYTHPVNADTGERLNWMRLPVLDQGWNETARHRAGFIQEATGWKPSALQQTMDVVQIAKVAGLYVPTLS
ncbi:hypothetical protein [Streptomyces sp. NPDC101776]|uniref:hypothetical protein n=1 Tax=Streptomyces sp. NPDC101776 TaxID=3366146 RepID=UPI003824A923